MIEKIGMDKLSFNHFFWLLIAIMVIVSSYYSYQIECIKKAQLSSAQHSQP